MWTTQGRCPHTHTSSSSDSQRYFDYLIILDWMGQAHVTTPRKSLGQMRTSPWLRHLCADSDSHSHRGKILRTWYKSVLQAS
jgi:hypothetical protein